MIKAKLTIIESSDFVFKSGQSVDGCIQQMPKVGASFFMYLNDSLPDGKNYVYFPYIAEIFHVEDELVMRCTTGVYSLKVEEDKTPKKEEYQEFINEMIANHSDGFTETPII